MGRLHGAAKLDEAMAGKLARQHLILLLVWAAHAVSVAACGVRRSRPATLRCPSHAQLGDAALPAVTAAVQMASSARRTRGWCKLVFLAAIATEILAFRLRQRAVVLPRRARRCGQQQRQQETAYAPTTRKRASASDNARNRSRSPGSPVLSRDTPDLLARPPSLGESFVGW